MGIFSGLSNSTPTTNAGSEHSNEFLFKAVSEQNRFESLHSRFAERDFITENRFWKFAATVASWLINCISVVGGFFGAYSLFSFFGAGEQISTALAVVLLVLLELARRKAADSIWDKWFKLRKVAAGFVVLNVAILFVSGMAGGWGIYKGVTIHAPQAPTLSDSVLVKMESELAALRADSETAKKTKWKGTVTVDAQRMLKNNSRAIANLTEKINDRRERLTGKQDATDNSHKGEIERAALIAVFVFFFLELLFQCCMAFVSYYDWREYILRTQQGQASILATTPPANVAISPDEMRRLIANTKTGGLYPLNFVHPTFAAYLQPTGTQQQSGATLPFIGAQNRGENEQPKTGEKTLDNYNYKPDTEAKSTTNEKGEIVQVPTDIFIQHKNRLTGRVQKMNITDVRRNLSANKSRLKKAASVESQADILAQVDYWQEKEKELIEKHQAIEAARVG